MGKSITLGLLILGTMALTEQLTLGTAIYVHQLDTLNYVSSEAFSGDSSYNNGSTGKLRLTLGTPETGKPGGFGMWKETRDDNTQMGPLMYKVNAHNQLIVALYSPNSTGKEIPIVQLQVRGQSTMGQPSVREKGIYAMTPEYFAQKRAAGESVALSGTIQGVDSDSYFAGLQEVNLVRQ